MTTESHLPWWSRRLTSILPAVGFLAVCIAFPPARAEAGSLVIPAWSFARGNGRIYTDPAKYADAGPVVGGGERKPWGWSLEYDIDIPVDGVYRLHIQYASAEARPIEVFYDARNVSKCCLGITLSSASAKKPNSPTGNSSAARWEMLLTRFGGPATMSARRGGKAKAGKHTVTLTSRGGLPHLVSLRLDTPEAFPDDWKPPRYKVRDLDSIPAAYRKAFLPPSGVDVAALRRPVKPAPGIRTRGSLQIPAWTFDGGNARIYASPDQYADAGPVAGSDPRQDKGGVVEYDIDFPVDAEYTLHVKYAAAEARPVEVFLDGKSMGICCVGVTFGSAPFELPVVFTSDSSGAVKKSEGLYDGNGTLVKMSITKGKHTLKFARSGPLPNLVGLRLDSSAAFPKGWKQPRRKMRHLDSLPVAQRSVFLPADAVNVAALRLAVQDTIKTFGPRYPGGPQYLKQLSELEKKPSEVFVTPGGKGFSAVRTWAGEENIPAEKRKTEEALKLLRSEAMLAHPALKFDKLLFFKRRPFNGNTYSDSGTNAEGGSLCVLSPVSPGGKVTSLVGELDGGIFTRFDLSFDAKKVVFGYKRKDKAFRIYEIDIDPAAGKMKPGSLRQLTFGGKEETEAIRSCTRVCPNLAGRINHGFDDMDPCYMPGGKIMFASTRSMRNVFCAGASVTTLYLIDADGKNMRRLSAGPLSEMDPCLLDDGRVAYTRWEYVDKGLGNGQSLWAVRPDGSGVDHVYKNSIIRPAQMLNTRSIPGSRRLVTVGAPHCGGREGGPVILVDNRVTRRSTEAMTCITPEISYPCMHQSTWDMGFFREPYPFSEKFFLVSHSPGPRGTGFGIYALDGWGNRAELYRDPKISCYQPVPLRPRRKPTQIAPVETADAKRKTGTLFIQDVYQGMKGIERGRVKYVRVMGPLPWRWSDNGIFRIGMVGNVHRKKVYGVTKVHEDGSAYFTVPAGENIFFQALDENFMVLQHMPTFINMMPGENRSCIGCHELRRKAPRMARLRPLAMDNPAQALAPQPGETGPRMVHYASDVQPVLDKHCVGCHSGKNPKGRLDLTGVPTDSWNRSYENIIGRGLISSRHCGFGRSGFHPQPPLSFGSHLSKLADRIRKAPCKAKITRGEFVRIVTWIDANAPYYGTYRGKRSISDKDHPDFRLPPLVVKH